MTLLRRRYAAFLLPVLALAAVLSACTFSSGTEEVFASPPFGKGESWSYTFEETGTYKILCRLHPNMRQTVHVVEPGGEAAGEATTEVDIQDFTFRPGEIRVEAGQTVTWSNLDAARHDVAGRRPAE